MFGIDEAGRGPVLGSMFIACVATDDSASLPEGLRDSKRLSKTRISSLAKEIHAESEIRTAVIEVPTELIDDPNETMTTVTVDAFADALTEITTPSEMGILDACHPDAEKFRTLVSEASSRPKKTLVSEHGADDEYPIVSAASIVAKDARERHVAMLGEIYGEVGSGYPSDPTTRTFLESYVEDNGELPDCTRLSWKTAETVLADFRGQGLADD